MILSSGIWMDEQLFVPAEGLRLIFGSTLNTVNYNNLTDMK